MDRPLGFKVVTCAIAGAALTFTADSAWAQHAPAKPAAGGAATPSADLAAARKHYSEGEKLYKAGDFSAALTEFKAANDIKSTAQAERNIALSEDALHDYRAAAEWYDKFLVDAPEKMATHIDEAKKRAGEIKAMPGKVRIESSPPGATVTVDDKPAKGPAPIDLELAPGPHTVKLVDPGYLPAEKTVDVGFASAETVTVNLVLAPPPPPVPAPPPPVTPPPALAPPPPPPPEPRSLVPAYVTGGLAIAAVGVGTVFGIMALGDKSDFDKTPTTSKADDGETHALIADMAFGVALTFGVTSAVLFLTRDEPAAAGSSTAAAAPPKPRRADNAIRLTPTPIVGPHTGGAGVLLRF
jgi:hypothetical protein